MYVFVTCNFFIITGPLLESTRLDGPDDQETLPYQLQDNDDQPTIPYSNDDQGLCRCLQSYEGESRRRNEGAAVHG